MIAHSSSHVTEFGVGQQKQDPANEKAGEEVKYAPHEAWATRPKVVTDDDSVISCEVDHDCHEESNYGRNKSQPNGRTHVWVPPDPPLHKPNEPDNNPHRDGKKRYHDRNQYVGAHSPRVCFICHLFILHQAVLMSASRSWGMPEECARIAFRTRNTRSARLRLEQIHRRSVDPSQDGDLTPGLAPRFALSLRAVFVS